jgi:hypothetical protein
MASTSLENLCTPTLNILCVDSTVFPNLKSNYKTFRRQDQSPSSGGRVMGWNKYPVRPEMQYYSEPLVNITATSTTRVYTTNTQSLLQMTSHSTTLRPLRVRQTAQIQPLFQSAVNESTRFDWMHSIYRCMSNWFPSTRKNVSYSTCCSLHVEILLVKL